MSAKMRWLAPLAASGVMLGMAPAAEADDAAVKELLAKAKCISCHSVKNQGVEKKVNEKTGKARKGPDLSGVGLEMDAEAISKFVMKESEQESVYKAGKQVKHKKKFKGSDEDLKQISEWLAAQKTKVDVPEEAGAEDEEDDKDE